MNSEQLEMIIEHRLSHCKMLLTKKGLEYAPVDRLANFKRAGKLLNCSPAKALIGMKAKHDVSILDIVDKIERNEKISYEMLQEKISDTINYLLLLEAIIRESDLE